MKWKEKRGILFPDSEWSVHRKRHVWSFQRARETARVKMLESKGSQEDSATSWRLPDGPRHCRRKLSPSAEGGQLRQRRSSGQLCRPELVTVEVRGFVSSCDCKSLVPDRRRDREVSLMCNCSACKPWLFLLVDGERPRSGKVSWKAEWTLCTLTVTGEINSGTWKLLLSLLFFKKMFIKTETSFFSLLCCTG